MRVNRFGVALSAVVVTGACSLAYPLDGYEGAAASDAATDERGSDGDDGPLDVAPAIDDASFPELRPLGARKLIANGQTEVRGVAADDAFVFWTASGPADAGIWRADKTSGAAAAIAVDLPGATAIAADALVFFTINAASGAIYGMQRNGTGLTTVAPDRPSPVSIAVDGAGIIWAEGSTIRAVARSGGALAALGDVGGLVRGVAVHDDTVYAVGATGLTRIPRAGGTSCTIDGAEGVAVAVDGTGAYWAGADGTIRRSITSCDQPSPSTTLATQQGAIAALALDEAAVYWVANVAGGANAARVRKGGGSVDVFGAALLGARGQAIAVDDAGVYWATACCIWQHGKGP